MGQGALSTNGFTNTSTTNNHITARGSDWLYAVCAMMSASSFTFMTLAFFKRRSQRLFHYLAASITLIAGIAYFCQGSNVGWTAIHVEFEHSDPKVAGNMRQIFYVRYINWFITTPLLLTCLLLTCAFPTPTILYTILIDEIMVIMGLCGALVATRYKWGFFTFACVAFFFVAFTVLFEGRAYARTLGADVLRTYNICGGWLMLMWLVYPVAWGVSEGGNIIPPDSEAIMYGILDLMSMPVFCAFFIWGHRNIDMERLGIHIRDANEAPATPATEKSATAPEVPITTPAAQNTAAV